MGIRTAMVLGGAILANAFALHAQTRPEGDAARIKAISPENKAIPTAVLSAISSAPLAYDVLVIDQENWPFDGQILKVNTLVLQPRTGILLRANTRPWLAVVAKTVKFAAPDEVAAIGVLANRAGIDNNNPFPAPQPASPGRKGNKGENGTSGSDGADGANGSDGPNGPGVPPLYIVAGSILTQPGNAPPSFIKLTISNPPRFGGAARPGQDGQPGGNGGDGGDGVWSASRFQCTTAARSGGPGGRGGNGGNGGNGGRGGDGGAVHYAGSPQAVDLLEYSVVKNFGQVGAPPGPGGAAGPGGRGGARGSHPGECTGGDRGPSGANGNPGTNGQSGAPGSRGAITSTTLNVDSIF